MEMLIGCKFSKEELEKNKGAILEALILCKEGVRFDVLPPEKTVYQLLLPKKKLNK